MAVRHYPGGMGVIFVWSPHTRLRIIKSFGGYISDFLKFYLNCSVLEYVLTKLSTILAL